MAWPQRTPATASRGARGARSTTIERMFATLAGAYPWPAELPSGEVLAAVVAAQVESGSA